MSKKSLDDLSIYDAAHLVAAAVRIVEFRDQQPPSPEAAAELLFVSTEQVLRLCRKLEEHNIIRTVAGGFGRKLFINDHLAIESLPHEAPANDMADELEKFKKKQGERDKKIEAIKQQEEERRKKLFAKIEQQLKGKKTSSGHPVEDDE